MILSLDSASCHGRPTCTPDKGVTKLRGVHKNICSHQAHDLPQRGARVQDGRHVGGVVADHARDPAAHALHHLQLLKLGDDLVQQRVGGVVEAEAVGAEYLDTQTLVVRPAPAQAAPGRAPAPTAPGGHAGQGEGGGGGGQGGRQVLPPLPADGGLSATISVDKIKNQILCRYQQWTPFISNRLSDLSALSTAVSMGVMGSQPSLYRVSSRSVTRRISSSFSILVILYREKQFD